MKRQRYEKHYITTGCYPKYAGVFDNVAQRYLSDNEILELQNALLKHMECINKIVYGRK